jgi:uncharacterized protein
VSFMTAKSDPGDYGQIQAFVMPQGSTVNGPVQVANSIQSDPNLAQQFTLLSQQGSAVVKGNIQLIPVGDSIVYVQPIFVQQSTQQGYPQFRFVVVFTQNKTPASGPTVNAALNTLFSGTPAPATPTTPTTPSTPTTPTPSTTNVQSLLNQASQQFAAAQQALRNGDLATYQQDITAAQNDVQQAQSALAGG